MKNINNIVQIGTPFTSLTAGMAMVSGFGLFTAATAHKAYYDKDICAGLSSIAGLLITGLATYNTVILCLSGEVEYMADTH